jgi:hypothetical protein
VRRCFRGKSRPDQSGGQASRTIRVTAGELSHGEALVEGEAHRAVAQHLAGHHHGCSENTLPSEDAGQLLVLEDAVLEGQHARHAQMPQIGQCGLRVVVFTVTSRTSAVWTTSGSVATVTGTVKSASPVITIPC